jgi:hypothetical protein
MKPRFENRFLLLRLNAIATVAMRATPKFMIVLRYVVLPISPIGRYGII